MNARALAHLCASAFIVIVAMVLSTLHAPAADVESGKRIFREGSEMPACAICHTLDDAGSTGTIGPNLDNLKPDADRVRAAVTNGVGVMPAFGESLTSEQIEAVSNYVASVAGR